MAVGFSSCSVINNVTMTSLLFGLDFTYYLSSFCLMCTFREIWIPPIILPISMTSDYVTVSIRSCPEFGDADYIIVWKFSGRSVSCFEDIDRGCDGCGQFPHRLQRSTFLLINYLKQRELILFLFLFAECVVKLKILWKSWQAHSRFPQKIF